ncbi:MAG TPA: protein kinase [Candidatus Polarisedimenticolia bacterium]|nr:protein kinase [Candidatus Polarisedimenticolia bacterium]
MALASGHRLGPYEIVGSLGAGGMGEVWRAKDTRLDREVAIKILPEAFAGNAAFLARFEREARSISALNHPHICTLFDVGHQDETHYLVMELLDGESLAKRLERGPLPLEQVLRFGAQIAEALHHAHKQGIIHRDLKPANVVLTKNGAKLLDFGLARTVPEGQAVIQGMTTLATEQQPLTQEGTILGTFQYMAPEQLEGMPADARTDLFALGAVLFEMATGKKAFAGKTRTSLIAAIVSSQPPPLSTIQPVAPAALEHVVRRCLEKDPEDRWQSAHDVAGELRWISEAGSQSSSSGPAVQPRRKRSRLVPLAGMALAGLAAAALGWIAGSRMRPAPPAPRMIRSVLLPPDGKTFNLIDNNIGALTVSPDGRYVTYTVRGGDADNELWLRPLDSDAARPIPGTRGAQFPFWSSDSRMIAFFAEGKLKKVDLAGSPSVTLCDASGGRSGSWNPDGVILFAPTAMSGIEQVSSAGGKPEPVTQLDEKKGETTHRWVSFLPDGRHFLYMAGSHSEGMRSETNAVYLGELGTDTKQLLLRVRSNAVVAGDSLLYVRDRILMGQKLDLRTFRLIGEPKPLAEGVGYDPQFFRASFGASSGDVVAYSTAGSLGETQLAWFDRTGKRIGDVGRPGDFVDIAISPDGTHLALSILDPEAATSDIWVEDLKRNTRTRLTFDPVGERDPVWSPDGQRIVYLRTAKNDDLFIKPAAGGTEEVLLRDESDKLATDWSRDGRLLVFQTTRNDHKTGWDIATLDMTKKSEPQIYLQTEFDEINGKLSPDGRWMLYLSNESGRHEAYIAPFPGTGAKWQVSQGGVEGADWGMGGKEVIVVAPEVGLLSISVEPRGAGLEIGVPKLLLDVREAVNGAIPRDAQRFLLALKPQSTKESPIFLINGWNGGKR